MVAPLTTILSNIQEPNRSLAQQITYESDEYQTFRAIAFTMPSEAYFLTSVSLVLSGFPEETGNPLVSILNYDRGPDRPGSAYATLVGPPGPPPVGISTVSFAPTHAILLKADQTYWLQLSQSGPGRFGWVFPEPMVQPTGVAQEDGTLRVSLRPVGDNYFLDHAWWNQFSIEGVAVPELNSVGLVILAAPFLLRRRRANKTR
ncbi:MAG: hypothetical protein HKN13_11300 [Rhodothermales bacterium]|nr:hypothetical protein [Rhodothermales bacterium]